MTKYILPRTLGIRKHLMRRPGGGSLFVISMFGLAPLDVESPDRFLAENGISPVVAEESPDGMGIFDLGQPKPWGEFMVAGHAIAPEGQEVSGMGLNIEFAGLRKKIAVFGDRYWQPNAMGFTYTFPKPFSKMKFDPALSYGGVGYHQNLKGRGFNAESRLAKQENVALPNFELADKLVSSIDDAPPPALLGIADLMSMERAKFAGTYDDEWLRAGARGYPKDIDPRFFCLAPPDQWLPDFFRGDESFSFSGFSSRRPSYSGKLPGFKARAFVSFEKNPKELIEVSSRLDTVFFLPSSEKAVLIWRAIVDCEDSEGEDIHAVMIAYDRLGELRDHAHYKKVYDLRIDKERGVDYNFSEHQLTPSLSMETLNSRFASRKRYQEKELEKNRDFLALMKKDMMDEMEGFLPPELDLLDLEPSPPPDFIPSPEEIESGEFDIADIMDGVAQLEEKMRKDSQEIIHKFDPVLKSLDSFKSNPSSDGLDSMLMAISETQNEKVPTYKSMIEGVSDRKSKIGDDDAGLFAKGEIDRIVGAMQNALHVEVDDALELAKQRFTNEGGGILEQKILKAMDAVPDKIIPNNNKGSDLINSMSASDFSIGDSSSKLNGSVLSDKTTGDVGGSFGAYSDDIKEKLASYDDKIQSSFPKLKTDGKGSAIESLASIVDNMPNDKKFTSLAEVEDEVKNRIEQVKGEVEDITNSERELRLESDAALAPDPILTAEQSKQLGQFILDAIKSGETLAGRDCAGADLSGADFGSLDVSGAFFERANLTGVNFRGASLKRAVFTEAILDGADFSDADLSYANFSDISAVGTIFQRAIMSDVNMREGNFEGANFSEVELSDLLFNKANFNNASFYKSKISQVNMIGVKANNIDARNADIEFWIVNDSEMRNLRLDGSKLECFYAVDTPISNISAVKASFKDCGFMDNPDISGGKFDDADFDGSNFSSANLFRASFRGANVNGLDFYRANLKEADISLSSLNDAQLVKANMIGVNGFGANCRNSSFESSDLSGASFRNSNFYSANFENANLVGADFTDCNLKYTEIGDSYAAT